MDVHPTKNVSIGIDPYPYILMASNWGWFMDSVNGIAYSKRVNLLFREKKQDLNVCVWYF